MKKSVQSSIRFSAEDLENAKKLDINLPELVRLALKQEISKRLKRCQCCGQAMPK